MVPLTAAEVDRYLARIGVDRPACADVETLAALQLAHLRSVPFENLDIHRDVPIVLDPDAIAHKVIERRRGGYCYEVNSTFGRLLATLGYGVAFVSARVLGDGELESQEFAHLALLVDVAGESVPYVVDVGFGASFEAPMPLVDGFERAEWAGWVGLRAAGDRWRFAMWPNDGDGWVGGYTFSTAPRRLEDFAGMNEWQQTAPESPFRRQTMCTMLVGERRITLAGRRLIETDAAGRRERDVADGEVPTILRERFGVTLDRGVARDGVPP